jgi:hypothetical protein
MKTSITSKERDLLKTFEKLYPRLTERQLDRLIFLAEDIIFMKDHESDSPKSA